MNSSGIKRGLATTAVSALAIAGLPLFASSASAAPGDTITIVSVSPVRNGGDQGAFIQATLKGVDPALVEIADANLTDRDPNTPNQTIGAVTVAQTIANGAAGDSNPNDGLAEAVFRVAPITTSADGGAFNFALFEDEVNTDTNADGTPDAENDSVDASEARVQVSGTTAGEVKAVQVSPASQSAPLNTPSGDYTLSFRDAAGRLTQLSGGETTTIALANGFAGATVDNPTITAAETRSGTATTKATGTTLGLKTFQYSGPATATGGTFNLDVLKAAANIGVDEIDVQSGVDEFNGFGDEGTYAFANDVEVRVDQTSVTIAVRDTSPNKDNANATLQLVGNAVGTVRFGGKTSTTLTTVLDANGAGSITFTPDAGTITAGSGINVVTPDGNTVRIRFERARFDGVVADANSYVSKFGGSVDVTLTSLDQFGLPIAGQYLAVKRDGGVNNDANISAKKVTDANGKVTFTLTDTKATAISNAKDDVFVYTYDDQFDATATFLADVADIFYTADGQGAEFAITVDNVTPAGAAYDPASISINPLTDGVADNTVAVNQGRLSNDEDITLDTSGGTPGVPVTVTADNGALILDAGETNLSQASASETGVIGDNFEIIGTKTGLVTLTITSGGKTKTAQVTVTKLADNSATARSISVSGPTEAVSGDTVAFAVKVTDAFGNPVANFSRNNLNVTVSGPGRFQDGDAVTNAQGVLNLNVRLDDDADSAVTVNVTVPSTVAQFGAAANRVLASDATNTGPGLPASVTTASATVSDITNLEALEQAVEDAEDAVAAAESALTNANANLATAQAVLAAAQADVKVLKQKLKKAKAKNKKAAVKRLKRKLAAAKAVRAEAKTAVASADAAVVSAQAALDAAEAELAEAEAALEDAKN